jgi:hypothetical protein
VHIHDVERTDTENNLVTDFDQLYRLLTYGYSVKLANDITVPATGNTAQRGSNETAGYKSVVINQGTFRGFSNPLVEIDLGEYTLSGLDGNTDALIKTNTPLIIDGTDGGAIVLVKVDILI